MNKFMDIRHQSLFSLLLVAAMAIALFWTNQGRADAPAGRYTILDQTVTDTKTGLVWERTPPTAKQTASEASSRCSGLALDNGKWRLPSMKELQTLVDESLVGPAIDPTAFPTASAGDYWTSSTTLPTGFSIWTVDFADGQSNSLSILAATAYSRCVR